MNLIELVAAINAGFIIEANADAFDVDDEDTDYGALDYEIDDAA